MKHKSAWLGISLMLVLSGTASAQTYGYGGRGSEPAYNGLYFGASAGGAFYNEDGIPQLTPAIAMFRIGAQFNPFLAIEGRIGSSIGDARSEGFRVNLDAIYGGYLKGMLPVTPWFSPYAIVGIGGAEIHRNYPDFNSNDAGLSFGGGTEFNLGNGASVNLEWVRLNNNADNFGYNYHTDLLTFGVNWHPFFW